MRNTIPTIFSLICLFSSNASAYQNGDKVDCHHYESSSHLISLKIFKNNKKKNYLNLSVEVDKDCKIVPHHIHQTAFALHWKMYTDDFGDVSTPWCELPNDKEYKKNLKKDDINALAKSAIISEDRRSMTLVVPGIQQLVKNLGNHTVLDNPINLSIQKTEDGQCNSELSLVLNDQKIIFNKIFVQILLIPKRIIKVVFSNNEEQVHEFKKSLK